MHTELVSEHLNEQVHSGEQGFNERIILKRVLKIKDVRVCRVVRKIETSDLHLLSPTHTSEIFIAIRSTGKYVTVGRSPFTKDMK
jgi:hypothetical protein